jgi:hypothetical protein
MISNMPRMAGRIVSGVQQMPTIVRRAVAEITNPQPRLTMPLASVVQAMMFTRAGFSG